MMRIIQSGTTPNAHLSKQPIPPHPSTPLRTAYFSCRESAVLLAQNVCGPQGL